MKTVAGYVAVNFEVAGSNSFRDIPRNHFVTAETDIDDSIKRKRFGVSLNNSFMGGGILNQTMK